jgi:hypothetical protein
VTRISVCAAVLASALAARSSTGDEPVDLAMIERIRAEARAETSVMETASALCDGIGPRLTGSPQMRQALAWTQQRLSRWHLSNVHLENWGPFGLGWEAEHVSVTLVRPERTPLLAYPKGWTRGTLGRKRATAILVRLESEADLPQYRGRLKRRVVLLQPAQRIPLREGSSVTRLSDADLQDLTSPVGPSPAPDGREHLARLRWRQTRARFLEEQGVVAVLTPGQRDGGTLLVADNGDFLALRQPTGVPHLVVADEHYNRIARLLERGQEVELELDIRTRFLPSEGATANVLAEIPGSERPKEIVMVGAHLDSWHGGTGATDDAAGVAVALEALRILKALGLKPRRTIRLGLWSGEEQGLLGSRAYVAEHFGWRDEPEDPRERALPFFLRPEAGRLHTRPDHARLSAYFNLDYGTGRIRGVYIHGNTLAAPIMAAWTTPLRDLGVAVVSPRAMVGSDHQAFESVGLPAFAFIHDDIEYTARTHHTNMDVFDRLQRDDLVQASIVTATLLYHAAMRPELMPRARP